MLFRQMFDKTSSTYTYLLASRRGGEALLIDPVFEQTGRYLKLLEEGAIVTAHLGYQSDPAGDAKAAARILVAAALDG